MSLSKRLLPTEGSDTDNTFVAQKPVEPHGMSLDEAIHEFIRIEQRQAELKREKADVLEVLLPEAFEVRGSASVARLAGQDGKVIKVEFKEAYKCDVKHLNTARDLLGDDKFEELFKTEYAPKLREMRMFLSSKSADERIETAKQIIREGVQAIQRSPYVSIEKD